MPLKIVIVGGGLVGLAAAAYLRKRHDVVVLERSQLDFTRIEYGYGISVIANAYGLLQKLGIKDENLDMAVMTHLWDRNSKNEELNTAVFDTRLMFGVPSVLTTRAKLHAELYRLATATDLEGKPAEVVTNVKVEKVDTVAGTVETSDGKAFTGDLLVGADGINSVVRSAVTSANGQGASEGEAKTHNLLAFMSHVPMDVVRKMPGLEYLTKPDQEAGIVNWYATKGPLDKKRILAYHNNPRTLQVIGYASESEFSKQFDEQKSTIIPDIPADRVHEDFAEFSDQVVGLFGKAKIDAWRIRDIEPVQQWYHGKGLIIGDAAHAVTPRESSRLGRETSANVLSTDAGQGCNTGFEDAEALAYLLRDAHTAEDVQAAFPKFISIRKQRAQDIARASRHVGAILPPNELEAAGEFDRQAFAVKTYGYAGAEAALAAKASA